MLPYSLLDLCSVVEGSDPADAFRRSADLALHAESLGFERFWLAEHHNMPGIASAATAVVIGHVAQATSTIRVGAGGVMLPNHSPLVVAEQFGTLASLFPGRIDLGLGRAPGTDQLTMRALRRDQGASVERFPEDVREILHYFGPEEPGQRVRAIPGQGLGVPVWLLGSSLYGAQLAAHLGLPYAFASHFAPAMLEDAVAIYRDRFRPSPHQPTPHVMVLANIFAADTDEEGSLLQTSMTLQFLRLRRGTPGLLTPPSVAALGDYSLTEQAGVAEAFRCSFAGGRETIARGLDGLIERLAPDELMITSPIYDHEARKRSLTLTADILRQR
jgi:luciferase family oxidoreductase group 1